MTGTNPWTKDQDDFVREHPGMTLLQLSAVTGHTVQSCKARRRMLCGSSNWRPMVKPDDEQHMIRWRKQIYGDAE